MALARGGTAVSAAVIPAGVSRPVEGVGDDAEPLDTAVRLVTPERIVFRYPLAGPSRRFCGYAADLALLAVLVVVAVVVSMALSLGSASGLGPALVAYFALTWGYGAVCEAFWNGRTAGKWLVGARVVTDQGVPITGAQAVLRNLVGVVDGPLPFFFLPSLACMALSPRFQRLGDLAAGTMVVVEGRRAQSGVVRVDEPAVAALLPRLPLRLAAGPDLARALSDYVRHRGRFNAAVREEMAGPLAGPLRRRFDLPAGSAGDAVLCATYHRVFLGE